MPSDSKYILSYEAKPSKVTAGLDLHDFGLELNWVITWVTNVLSFHRQSLDTSTKLPFEYVPKFLHQVSGACHKHVHIQQISALYLDNSSLAQRLLISILMCLNCCLNVIGQTACFTFASANQPYRCFISIVLFFQLGEGALLLVAINQPLCIHLWIRLELRINQRKLECFFLLKTNLSLYFKYL